MQEPLKRRASVFAAQVESFIKTAELIKPRVFPAKYAQPGSKEISRP